MERAGVIELTAEQRARLEEWSRARLAELAARFDVDITDSAKCVSWGLRIVSTLGGLAVCAAVVLFFMRYWGYLHTPIQLAIVIAAPLAALAATEVAARRERTLYFAGLMALVALACFIMNLTVVGLIFNIAATEKALAAWGAFALLLAYRYGLRPMLVLGIGFLLSYGAAALAARLGHHWLYFGDRPEHFIAMGLAVFAVPLAVRHRRHSDFPAVYRLAGTLVLLFALLALAEWGANSYLPLKKETIEKLYEFAGLAASAAAIWRGIVRQWDGVVYCGASFFVIFLFCRLYHWWWGWMPKYLFFAVIGGIAIVLVAAFKRVRARMKEADAE